MSSIKTILIGHVGATPKVEMISNDRKKASFSVAVNSVTLKGEDKIEQTKWHQVVFYGSKADKVDELISKGNQVEITGQIIAKPYLDKAGKPQVFVQLVGRRFKVLPKATPKVKVTEEAVLA